MLFKTLVSSFIASLLIIVAASAVAAADRTPSSEPASRTAHATDAPAGFVEVIGGTDREQAAQRAIERWGKMGVDKRASEVRVFEDSSTGDKLVVSAGLVVDALTISRERDGVVIGGRFRAGPTQGRSGNSQITPRLSSHSAWQHHSDFCAAQYTGAYGSEISTCYQVKVLANDHSSTWDYYIFQLYSTFNGGDEYLDWADLASFNANPWGVPQTWVQWDPGSDWTGNCDSSYSVSVAIFGVGYSWPHTRCESWDITKDASGGDFAIRWDGNVQSADREAGYMTLTKVADGRSPSWIWSHNYRVCLGGWVLCEVEP